MSKQRAIAAEGRAIAARPSLCLRLIAVLLGVAILAPSAATAAEGAPSRVRISATDPVSSAGETAETTMPTVFGLEEEEGTATGVRTPPHGLFAVAAMTNPADEVFIYAGSCSGTPIGEGTLEELEDESIGIEVVVPADQKTLLFADQTYPGEPTHSTCSLSGFPYYEGAVPFEEEGGESPGGGGSPEGESPGGGNGSGATATPPQAPHIHLEPGQRANDNTPLVAGSAPGAERVKVFANTGCAGTPLANVSAAEFAAGINVHVDDNSTTNFAGVSVTGGRQSFCSPPATYIEDSSPPHVRITMGPGVKTRRHKAVFRFTAGSEEPGASFKCRLNHSKWRSCHSPFKLKHLHFRRYVLRVRGTDAVGNVTRKPAKRSFKVIH